MERDKPSRGVATVYAKQQRENASDAERRLWSILRRKHIAGEPFKRRESIGPYLADFYCAGAKLVILLDDGQPDTARELPTTTQWLSSQGYQVQRLSAEDVRRNPWIKVKEIARRFRMRNVPPKDVSQWKTGPSNQS